MYSIKTCKLTKKYKDKVAVNEIDLLIKKGELFSLLGVNGAGKTTTIKMLSGLILPTSGDISINDMDMKKDIYKIIPVSLEQSSLRNKNYIVGYNPLDSSIRLIELAVILDISYLKDSFIISDDKIEHICSQAYDILNKEEE